MKDAIKSRARTLGFDDCRITSAEEPASGDYLKKWLAEANHGEMAYLAKNADKRIDPQKVLPGARSIVTLAASYCPPRGVPGDGTPTLGQADQNVAVPAAEEGRVARYAQFRDYHDVLAERLKHLSAFMDGLGRSGTRSLWYADTGPVLERDLAQRSGLGFIGKHTNLVHRQLGNWFFLAEIITTLELEPDAPEKNRCGACQRCISACPTGAITGPFQLDARLCISYLTIELKGPIPEALRPAMGNRIYGCDDCLAACPWNRFSREGALMSPCARPDLQRPRLTEWLALDEPGFKRLFAGTPLLRTKRRGLLRNVCVALGNTGGSETLPALEKAARDPEPLVAEHAHWAIGRILQRGLCP